MIQSVSTTKVEVVGKVSKIQNSIISNFSSMASKFSMNEMNIIKNISCKIIVKVL